MLMEPRVTNAVRPGKLLANRKLTSRLRGSQPGGLSIDLRPRVLDLVDACSSRRRHRDTLLRRQEVDRDVLGDLTTGLLHLIGDRSSQASTFERGISLRLESSFERGRHGMAGIAEVGDGHVQTPVIPERAYLSGTIAYRTNVVPAPVRANPLSIRAGQAEVSVRTTKIGFQMDEA